MGFSIVSTSGVVKHLSKLEDLKGSSIVKENESDITGYRIFFWEYLLFGSL